VKAGRFTPGNVAEFIIYLNMLIWPVASLGWTTALVQKASASPKRINEFLSEAEQNDSGSKKLEDFDSLQLQISSYQYFDKDFPALHDINFDISRGSFVGILGKTGSGKSTLIQLLTQQITRSNGSFYINNRPVEEYSLTSFRSKIAYVQQDTFLFSDTIRENILFGGSRSDKDNERLNQAVSYAFLEKDLMELPMGLDTLIGERGVSLSGGQKQRVALARALMKDAELYFLDDCLSAVDAETEAEGWTVINSLRGGDAGGGTRMRKGLDMNEVLSLAKTMEVKFTVSGPPIGGAKSGINFDPSDPRKKGVLERWYKAVIPILKAYYGTGGDLNIDEIHEVIPITEDCGVWHPQEGVFNGHFQPREAQKIHRIGQLRNGVLKVIESPGKVSE
jgi:ABC-type Mn2+/Zn2+ transport system ATPase subunit